VDADATPITEAGMGGQGSVALIGNEGNGVSKEIIEKSSDRITIKMDGRAESLNANAAASIIMWEMTR
jgi:TrmH family RNA methyltransferase